MITSGLKLNLSKAKIWIHFLFACNKRVGLAYSLKAFEDISCKVMKEYLKHHFSLYNFTEVTWLQYPWKGTNLFRVTENRRITLKEKINSKEVISTLIF